MNIDETKKNINSFLKDSIIVHSYFSNKQKNILSKSYEMIVDDINLMISEQQYKFNVDTKLILNSFDILKKTTILYPINEKYSKFVISYCQLVKNWNDNLSNNGCDKHEKIEIEVLVNIRLIDQYLTIVESCNQLKLVTRHLNDIRSWLPPSFDISKHYIDMLK